MLAQFGNRTSQFFLLGADESLCIGVAAKAETHNLDTKGVYVTAVIYKRAPLPTPLQRALTESNDRNYF